MAKRKKSLESTETELKILHDPPEEWPGSKLKELLSKTIPAAAKRIDEGKVYLVGWHDDCVSFEQMNLYYERYITWKGNSSSALIYEDDVAKKYIWEADKEIISERTVFVEPIEYVKEKIITKKVRLGK